MHFLQRLRASEVALLLIQDWDDREEILYVHQLKGFRSAPFTMHDRELCVETWEVGRARRRHFPAIPVGLD
jgi:hypothetical protein